MATTNNKTYQFNTDDAIKYGSADAAAILFNLRFWLDKNKANEINKPEGKQPHIHDGRIWTYNSIEAWQTLFPWLSGSQIRRLLIKLEKTGILLKRQFKKSALDQTIWYTLDEPEYRLENEQNTAVAPETKDLTKSTNGVDEIDKWILRNRQMLHIENKQISSKSVNNTRAREKLSDADFEKAVMLELMADYLPDQKVKYAQLKIREYITRFPDSQSIADCWAYTIKAVLHQIELNGEVHLLNKKETNSA